MEKNPTNTDLDAREELHRELLRDRREFLKKALRTAGYVTPVAMSFAAQDLARAASCPEWGTAATAVGLTACEPIATLDCPDTPTKSLRRVSALIDAAAIHHGPGA